MDKQGKKALVPRLRFPEFRDAEGWGARKLKTACEVNPSNSGLPETFVYIDLESVEAGELKLRKVIDRINAPSRAQRVLRYGDVIFQIVRPYQRNNLLFNIDEDIPFVASTGYAQLRAIDSVGFLFQAIHADDFVERVITKCTGSNYPAINSSDLADIYITLPGKAEQQKIADCLSSLDEVISAENQKLETFKKYKKGLMQQLFPREGETVPRLRFAEFRDAGEWKESKLGELTSIVRGGSPRPIDQFLTSAADGLNWLKIGDVDRDAKYITSTEERVRAEALSKTRVIQPGDFILSNSMSFGRPYISTIQTCIHDGWIAVTKIPASLNSDFLYYALLSERSQKYFLDRAAGGGVQNLNKDIIKTLMLGFPEVEEQQSIADCLSSLDNLVTTQAEKVEALKDHKKGLMQQLFPVLDEVPV